MKGDLQKVIAMTEKKPLLFEFTGDWRQVNVSMPDETKRLRDHCLMNYLRYVSGTVKEGLIQVNPKRLESLWMGAFENGITAGTLLAEAAQKGKAKAKKKLTRKKRVSK